MSAGNINWAFGDGGDVEDLSDVASKYGYHLCSDDLWREDMTEKGLTDEQMWDYVQDRRESEAEDWIERGE